MEVSQANSEAYASQGLYKRIKGRHGAYVDIRKPWDPQRNTICELLRPDLVPGSMGDEKEGGFEGLKIVEGTGPHAALTWQRGFTGGMISRKKGMEWFRETLREPPAWTGVTFKGNDEINRYCQNLAEHMVCLYRRSNY